VLPTDRGEPVETHPLTLGVAPSVMNRLPRPVSEVLPLEIQRQVVAACERFENSWRAGEKPTIENQLEDLGPVERSAVLHELVALEVELRSRDGERPTLAEFADRFPDDASVISAVFASSIMHLADSGPATVPAPGLLADAAGRVATAASTAEKGTQGRAGDNGADPMPQWLGRYQVVRLLGHGNFGRVYLARDLELDRDVAIKVPTIQSRRLPGRLEALVAEGRLAAALKHPAIVAVYDIGRDDNGLAFVVLEYVEGTTLADVLRQGRIEPVRIAEVIATIADALHHAHRAGLVHRDLKPSNIIIDVQGLARVSDFGLALTESMQVDRAGEVAGTPSYMAPEQVRGEAHRLDGRTDVWALGVILYQGLTGRLPFAARDRTALFDEILHREPKPPRQIIDGLPRELERVCQKCLSSHMIDRYQTAADLVDDLRAWLASHSRAAGGISETPPDGPLSVVPKGLRAFDGGDFESFLALLPGPRGRDGLPESIRFWKSSIECDNERAFPIGLLYGRSGGGKSSLMRAGLLPRLGEFVRPIYVECSRDWTESCLAAELHRLCPGLPANCGLEQALALLREGELAPPDVKVLIILDQFEQWLQSHVSDRDQPLVNALRHCDGRRVQAVILTRDDFWMAITRFFRALELPLAEGVNSAPVELLDSKHARLVLKAFGHACGRFSGPGGEPTDDENRFLDFASAGLAGSDDGVAPVRLSLLVEVVRRRAWTPATLIALGGVDGIGLTFLQETFDRDASPPSYKELAVGAKAVLQALLPASSSTLKAPARPVSELGRASGLARGSSAFERLLFVLDRELRMISMVDQQLAEPPSTFKESPPDEASQREAMYQLAHDEMVSPIRKWIESKDGQTRAGRARLRLATIAAAWEERKEARRLPSLGEWASILLYSRRAPWTAVERSMMHAATVLHVRNAVTVSAVIVALTFGVSTLIQRERVRELGRRTLASSPASLQPIMPDVLKNLSSLLAWFEQVEGDRSQPEQARRNAKLIAFHSHPSIARADALHGWLSSAGAEETALIRDAFAKNLRTDSPSLPRSCVLPLSWLRSIRAAISTSLTQSLFSSSRRS
jgi:eukaryotic-like serine/threonine-protein kinase